MSLTGTEILNKRKWNLSLSYEIIKGKYCETIREYMTYFGYSRVRRWEIIDGGAFRIKEMG